MSGPRRTRALPRQRKIFGTSHDIDGDVMVYTESQVAAFGDACFADGYRACEARFREALRTIQATPTTATSHPIQAEDDAWADYKAGRGPRPIGRR